MGKVNEGDDPSGRWIILLVLENNLYMLPSTDRFHCRKMVSIRGIKYNEDSLCETKKIKLKLEKPKFHRGGKCIYAID